MKRPAFIFTQPPHGLAAGREGLDALLAASACSAPGVFFIGDGVLQLLTSQQPELILARDYIATFKVLPLYDIHDCWICAYSLRQRGVSHCPRVIHVSPLEPEALRQKLDSYDVLLTF